MGPVFVGKALNQAAAEDARDECGNRPHDREERPDLDAAYMEAVVQAKTVSTRVAELGKAANEVGKVTEVINDISEETDLLADGQRSWLNMIH